MPIPLHHSTRDPPQLPMSSTSELQQKILKENALIDSYSQPVYVTKVEVNGGDNFSRPFFNKLLAPVIQQSDYTLAQLLTHVDQCRKNLLKSHVFSKIDSSLDIDYTQPQPSVKRYNLDKSLLTKIVFDLEPDEQKTGVVAFDFNTEENLAVGLGYSDNNFDGNAELVQIGIDYRPYKPSEHLFLKIHIESALSNPSYRFISEFYNTNESNQLWLHNSSKSLGGLFGIRYVDDVNSLDVFNGLSFSRRSIFDVNDQEASKTAKSFEGDFFKLSLLSKMSFSTLHSQKSTLPPCGSRLILSNEFVSEQPQQKFDQTPTYWMKFSALFETFKSFGNKTYTSHFFSEVGAIKSGQPNRVHISDRFYLGGFGSFPGFSRNGVQINGGMHFYKLGATLYSRLPNAKKLTNDVNPLRCYVTAMVGNVFDSVIKESGVVSTGVGLRYFSKSVRLDAGYYLALRLNSDHDIGVKDGFQLEVSIGGTS